MLRALVSGLSSAGLQVLVPLDVRLFTPTALAQFASQAQILPVEQLQSADYLSAWRDVASKCVWSWLVAPELDDTLRQVASQLRTSGAQLLNASDDFLRVASDKNACAQLWQPAGVPHPSTRPLQAIDDEWLSESSLRMAMTQSLSGDHDMRWVVKRADGAGGEGLRMVDRRQLLQLKTSLAKVRDASPNSAESITWIVQPWLHGNAASCSAIVDVSGRPHWLPLVSQDFEPIASPSCSEAAPVYLGCTYPAPGIPQIVPEDLLHKTLTSLPGTPLGWISVDLLYDPLTEQWWVIEINPRCTSSLIGLAAAYPGNLVYDIYQLQTGGSCDFSVLFEPLVFRLS